MLFFSSAPSSSSVSEYIEFVPNFSARRPVHPFFVLWQKRLLFLALGIPRKCAYPLRTILFQRMGGIFLLSQSNISFFISFCCSFCFFSSCIRSSCDSFDFFFLFLIYLLLLLQPAIATVFVLGAEYPIPPTYLPASLEPRPLSAQAGGLLHSCSSKRVTCVFIMTPEPDIPLPMTHQIYLPTRLLSTSFPSVGSE